MNHAYKSIWNESTGTFVAVAENVKSKGKRSSSRRAAAVLSALAAVGLSAAMVAPDAMAIVAPDTITAGNNVTVTKSSFGAFNLLRDYKIGLSNTLDLTAAGSVMMGDALVNTSGFALAGGPSITTLGLDGGALAITNVADGVNLSDAVNKKQLDANKTHFYSVNSTDSTRGNYNNDGATGIDAMAAGIDAEASGDYSTALGTGAKASLGYSTAVGVNAEAARIGSTALGFASKATKFHSTALGHKAEATAVQASAVGDQALASGVQASAFGAQAAATGDYTTALGSGAKASLGYSTAVGVNAEAARIGSTALGFASKATKFHSTALGHKAEATAVSATAVGDNAKATERNSVALGSNSETAEAVATPGIVLLGETYSFAGAAPIATVSVGAVGNERTITNVAAGRISDTSTDAINGSQLFATNTAVEDLNNTVVANKTHFYSVNSTDSTRGNYNNDGATGIDSMAAGIDAKAQGYLSTAVGTGAEAKGVSSTAMGAGAKATGLFTTAVGAGAEAKYISSTAMGANAKAQGFFATAIGDGAQANHTNSVALGAFSETATTVATPSILLLGETYNFAGARPVGTVSVGSVGKERTITNVAAGRISGTSTDAINGSQLHATNQAIGTLSGSVGELGDRAVKYDGIEGAPKDTITLQGTNGTKITNLADGIIATDSKDAVNGGQIQTVGDSIAAGMGGTSKFENGKLVTELNVGGASFSNVNDALGGVYNNLSTQLYDIGATAGAGWNVTDADNNSANIGPNGQVAFIGDQNVSVKQTGTKDKGQVEVTLNQDLKLNSITAVKVNATNVTADDITINKGGPIISSSGIDMRDKQITGVAAGSAPSHAVNLGQLEGVRNDLHGEINNVRRDLHKVDRKLRAGVAAAMATAGLPQAYMPGKSMVAMGGGTWNGESGLALGLSKITDSGKWVFKVSGNASTRGDYGGTVGAGYQW